MGGTRCPDCGIQVRPHKLIPGGDRRIPNGFLTVGVQPNCAEIKGCKGETPDWQDKAADLYEKKMKKQ